MANKFVAWLTGTGPSAPAQKFSTGDTRQYSMAEWLSSGFGSGDSTSREAALKVPAVLRGRNMIANIATLPLRLLDTTRKPVREALFEQFDPQVPNVVHLSMTVEDLLMDAVAWWVVTDRELSGFPRAVRHVDSRRVTVVPPKGYNNPLPSGLDPSSVVWVDGKPFDGRNMIRFDSPNPPLLVAGRRAIKRAVLLEDAAAMYAEDPRALDYFTPADGAAGLEDDEVRSILSSWIAARKKRSTGYVPETLKYNTVQAPNPQELQLVGLMERAALDIANAIGVDPEDLGISTTSRTYQNATDRRQDRVNDVLSGYMRAITDRLSMADVTRGGYRAYFDLDDYMRADPTTRWAVNKTAFEIGATDIAEIREREDWVERPELGVTEDTTKGVDGPVEAREIAELIQKIYLGVGKVLTADEARAIANRAGAGLVGPLPVDAAATVTASDDSEQVVLSATGGSMEKVEFSDTEGIDSRVSLRFDTISDDTTFAVKADRRTITGTAMLYGVEADNGSGKFTFARGSLNWNKAQVSRVKFLRDHNWSSLLGAATILNDLGDRVEATFKVARGAAGDQALAEAEDGALDGLSVGIDILEWEESPSGGFHVTKARLNEVSLTPRPAFDDARLTKVTASKKDTITVEETVTEEITPDVPAIDVDAVVAAALSKHDEATEARINEAVSAALSKVTPVAVVEAPVVEPKEEVTLSVESEKPAVVNPVRDLPSASFEVAEKSAYRFDRAGRFSKGEHEFSTDLAEMLKRGDSTGENTEFGKRVMEHIRESFAVTSTGVASLNPAINRPDLYVNPPGNRTPLWDLINKGDLPNGLQPFTLPKFATGTGLVAAHVEGTEPTPGAFTTTSQTITPSALSGKVQVSREVFDMGGNPAISNLIWDRMVRVYSESLEAAAATHVGTLTAAADITLAGGAGTDAAVIASLQSGIVGLNFAPAYDFSAFAVERVLYAKLANLLSSDGRPVFPALGASNSNGTVGNLFQSLNINGLRGIPVGALASTPAALNSSWIFDPSTIHGYATAPQRLEFAGSTGAAGTVYGPVQGVDLALFGYSAFANTDIGGVRQVTFDSDLA